MRRQLLAMLVGAALSACIPGAFGIEVVEPPPPPPEPHVPDRFVGEGAPQLVPSQIPGFQIAPSLDARLYYQEKERQWYRFAMNRWYLAFTWDGNWFPVEPEEVPAELQALTTQMREISAEETRKTEKSRDEQLRELDEKLRELEQAP